MANYWMQLIRIAETAEQWNGQAFDRKSITSDLPAQGYQPVDGAPVTELSADDLDTAKKEAAEHWRIYPHAVEFQGYWIVEAEKGCQFIYDHAQTIDRQLAKARSF